MPDSNVSLDLMAYVETEILPRYNAFDKAHNLGHALRVIKASVQLAKQTGADINMCYTIAAYHDLGLEGPRAVHHITSGKILMADRRLRRWFSPHQIATMKEAVEDHRASASHAPRSIYGKIVAEADRDLDGDTVFRRTIDYGREHYPEMSKEEHFARFRDHLRNKYSATGYIRLWIPASDNARKLREIQTIIADAQLLRQRFEDIYNNS